MKSKKYPFVSVVIPTYNRGRPFCGTLKSLFSLDYTNYEVIVVDQSTKKFSEKESFLRKNRDRLIYLTSSLANASLARNIGIKRAKGEIILFLDDDVVCLKDLILNHIKSYQDKGVGAVAGRVVTYGQAPEFNRDNVGKITPWGKFSGGFSSRIRQEVMTAVTCNASWRKKILERLNGFDEAFTGPIREDTDLSFRTRKLGYKIIFDPAASVVHMRAKRGGFRKSEGRLNWYLGFFKSEAYFSLKHLHWYWLWLFWLIRWQYFFRCMFGFGREISIRSLKTPWLGIYQGYKVYRRGKG